MFCLDYVVYWLGLFHTDWNLSASSLPSSKLSNTVCKGLLLYRYQLQPEIWFLRSFIFYPVWWSFAKYHVIMYECQLLMYKSQLLIYKCQLLMYTVSGDHVHRAGWSCKVSMYEVLSDHWGSVRGSFTQCQVIFYKLSSDHVCSLTHQIIVLIRHLQPGRYAVPGVQEGPPLSLLRQVVYEDSHHFRPRGW